MTPLEAGAPLPDLTLDGPDGPVRLHEAAAAGPLIIAFYQEDATPICTAQLCAFRDDFDLIAEAGASFVAISADDRTSQARFGDAQSFPFPLLSDTGLAAARAFGVVDESGRRSLRAVFVSGPSLAIDLALPYYHPANPNQFPAVFAAIGLDFG
jgi:peroxiredoxin Q/BCP